MFFASGHLREKKRNLGVILNIGERSPIFGGRLVETDDLAAAY